MNDALLVHVPQALAHLPDVLDDLGLGHGVGFIGHAVKKLTARQAEREARNLLRI